MEEKHVFKHTDDKHSIRHIEPGRKAEPRANDASIYIGILLVAALILFNQYQISSVSGLISGGTTVSTSTASTAASGSSGSFGSFGLDSKSVIGPVLLDAGEAPALDGYKTKFKKLPTISEHEIPASTGDAAQDAVNALIPTGKPFYGDELGVSFDDPLGSKTKLGQYEKATKLEGAALDRYNHIVGAFTCDFCCGSPKNPTVINRCGCAHAAAWRGLAKYFVQQGDKYSDLQILGEMTRWKALWYPGPIVNRLLQEFGSESTGASTASAPANVKSLPQMVGGC
ncbi:hypothetical protein HY642_03190 [Candidatus Woesearchaeota archaeon]|nr:hypothetical protein [Candidatus Woesearchaeota archaeon]